MHRSDLHPIIRRWFDSWEARRPDQLPITDDFIHTSPFGDIVSAERYLDLVDKNQEAFFENEYEIGNQIVQGDQACVQYELVNARGRMPVCEWYVFEGDRIKRIYAYYNIGNAEIKG